ncbi:MAG: SHOCT domain-containing protein [Halanaeroarchaeum sp.]
MPFFGFLWPLLFLAVLVWLLTDGLGADRGVASGPPEDAAVTTLRESYARGEITEDEFEARRRRLQQ